MVTHGEPLSDTRFYLHGESPAVAEAVADYLSERGAQVARLNRLNDFTHNDDSAAVLLVHIAAQAGLAQRLGRLKAEFPSVRILLLHEFTDRGRIDSELLGVADQLLEKPFSRTHFDKALARFRFHPLTGRNVYLFAPAGAQTEEHILRALGATTLRRLPDSATKLAIDLGIFAPAALDADFKSALRHFRTSYENVPLFLLYDPQMPGVLDSEILSEIAYLVQKPVQRDTLRQKFIAYFEQPQRDRRKNPRKQGISQLWISSFNNEIGTTELFESPFLIDISRSGLSFQSHVEYPENQLMAVWIVSEDYPDKILDLRGHIRWKKSESVPGDANARLLKYGVEFTQNNSEAYLNFARMIAMHSG